MIRKIVFILLSSSLLLVANSEGNVTVDMEKKQKVESSSSEVHKSFKKENAKLKEQLEQFKNDLSKKEKDFDELEKKYQKTQESWFSWIGLLKIIGGLWFVALIFFFIRKKFF